MMIGLHALELVPKKAAGTAAGFTGFFGYAFGSAIAGTLAAPQLLAAQFDLQPERRRGHHRPRRTRRAGAHGHRRRRASLARAAR
jgi:hypothetical protein